MTSEAEFAERRERLLGPMQGLSGDELKREVRDAYTDLQAAIESFSNEQAVWKPTEGEWSAAQVGDHVALSTGTLGNITAVLARGQTVTDADWDPPPRFRGDVSDVRNVKRRLAELSSYTDRLFDEGASTDRLDVKANNSFLGDMTWREWFYFLGIHARAHIEQIEKLRLSPGFPT
jgi:hypothetical protein